MGAEDGPTTIRFGNGIQSMLEGRRSQVVPASTTTTTMAEFTPLSSQSGAIRQVAYQCTLEIGSNRRRRFFTARHRYTFGQSSTGSRLSSGPCLKVPHDRRARTWLFHRSATRNGVVVDLSRKQTSNNATIDEVLK